MSSEAKLELTFWEKLTDTFGSISEGVVGVLGKLFGSSNEKLIRSTGYIRTKGSDAHSIIPGSLLDQVNSWEEHMQSLSDDDLKGMTAAFRERLEGGETLEDLLPEAFAAVREAGRRFKNMRHFDVQIVGGIMLHQGKIAEMVTGEGKTLVATLPAFLNGLTAKGVHVITVNDYLARRDCEWMSPIYNGLGMTAGFIQSEMDAPARRKAYDCDITYGTNSEFGFDYLRDNMKPARWGDPNYDPRLHQVQRGLNYAIIDEVDNILIDEARTPLIISGDASGAPKHYEKANDIALQLTRLEKEAQKKLRAIGHGLNIPGHVLSDEQEAEDGEAANGVQDKAVTQGVVDKPAKTKENRPLDEEEQAEIDVSQIELPPEEKKQKRLGYYFEVKEKERSCHLTDEGVRKAEELAGVESFYTAGNMEWPHLLDNALKAQHLYHKDKDYVVMRDPESNKMAIIIVDTFTGRLMLGRQWSDGLHQAVEAKHKREGVEIKKETQTLATITLQNYFRLYKKLAGMTGTAMTEAGEFWKIYKLEVVNIPTNRPLNRINYPDMVFMSEKEKWEAVVLELEMIHKFDVVHMKDGTELIGQIKNETDTEVVIELKESREKQTINVDDIEEADRKGRPILVGTTSVEKSEKLKRMLDRKGIKSELLNAKPEHAGREADIVAQAGRIGAVTIATNMAGRGTDIILGGNAETLAWARLKDKYATRLDVPEEEWRTLVAEIRAKENMEEEGREVVEMGGLHIVGTERHESRRIDNQLRGRAGRQGDPGTSRFYVSLQDDLMRIFGGEWVASWLQRMGMQEGEAIENRMVTRRIEGCQKKVEEHNFDIRKNLLEYDEVMDYQRKRVYGYRQEILNNANCKLRIWDMLVKQIDLALDRYLDDNYGPASFAELVQQQLNVEVDASDFTRCRYEEAERIAREKAHNMVQTNIHEAMDENLDTEVDQAEWNWQAMADRVNKMWGLKTTDRQLKKIGRDDVAEYLIKEANQKIADVDLTKGREYLESNWGLHELCSWLERKLEIQIKPEDIDVERPRAELRERLVEELRKLYHQKEVEFPVAVATARFSQVAPGPTGRPTLVRIDREGLYQWFTMRFRSEGALSDETFRTESPSKLRELLADLSRKSFPEATQDDIDNVLREALEGAKVLEEADAQDLAAWVNEHLKIEIAPDELVGLSFDEARNRLWNEFDKKYRPEMKRLERSLLLNQLDLAWKNHLLTMDHLRQGIGLVGYAQIDPKTEFKRVGMKEFDAMWDTLGGKVTDVFFKLEDEEAFAESVWAIGATVHESAPQPVAASAAGGGTQAQYDAATAPSASDKKAEPIRNRSERVGRNDPCPCGSGKKYKNCCMRHAVK
jgi:preprotein translocase subunit SecA